MALGDPDTRESGARVVLVAVIGLLGLFLETWVGVASSLAPPPNRGEDAREDTVASEVDGEDGKKKDMGWDTSNLKCQFYRCRCCSCYRCCCCCRSSSLLRFSYFLLNKKIQKKLLVLVPQGRDVRGVE